jgi:tetratricopeptide (TPR) repeat protein
MGNRFSLTLMARSAFAAVFLLHIHSSALAAENNTKDESGYLGSPKCRSCHENFYRLWATSHHGLAMQPYTEAFAEANLKPQLDDVVVGETRYRAVIDEGPGFVIESTSGSQKKHRMLHVLGGKNVYYFLTSLDRGRLQTLPVAYDVNTQVWFDTAASGVRHFPDRTDEAIHWTDRAYTFNTSCYGCHVSQLVKNYDLETDSYNTQWQEPGINCETCHGPAEEHVRLFTEAGEGPVPSEPKLKTITQDRGYSAHQVDSSCLTCHTKGMPIASEFNPGDSFFQYSDAVTLEHQDYYPDGRDLGENYTFSSWRMSACTKDGKLDCLYCHSSSGRYRFKDVNPNAACTSCHEDKKDQIVSHSRHKKGATKCVDCHMPTTRFAGMMRSDHSMRPPMPSATIQFQSPNACNLCHDDQDAKWADEQVRLWHQNDYQKSTLEIATLIDEARKNKWNNLSKMLAYLQRPDKDEIFANSLVRLMRAHHSEQIGKALVKLLDDSSPLIRSSAADGLEPYLNKDTIEVLAGATKDPVRLVRIRAVPTLASVPEHLIPTDLRMPLQKATEEYISSMGSRPDDAMAYYNLGNYYAAKNKSQQAIKSYETSIQLRDDMVLPYVNASLVYNRIGNNDKAKENLKKAIAIDPKNEVAHLNLALLYGEMGQYDKAIEEFKTTFKLDPASAVAAYNLCILLSEKDALESIAWAQKAADLQPDNAKYAYTLGFYLYGAKRVEEAIGILEPFVDRKTTEINIYMLLGEIYERTEDINAAMRVYRTGAENRRLPSQARSGFEFQLQRLMTQ